MSRISTAFIKLGIKNEIIFDISEYWLHIYSRAI